MAPRRPLLRPTAAAALALASLAAPVHGFAPSPRPLAPRTAPASSTSLDAIGVFVRKAREADVRAYCEAGPPDAVLAKLKQIKDYSGEFPVEVGEVQEALTRRKGTITVVAGQTDLLPRRRPASWPGRPRRIPS